MALRRLKPLLGAFEHIDAAIEAAADDSSCRDEFRRARARIVEMVCDAAAADDGAGAEKAEGLCALLEEAMAESLATLRAVPLEMTALASGGLVGAVDALMREHPSERIRGLAGDVVRGWRAGVKAEIARARAKLDALPSTPPPHPRHDDTAPAADSDTKAKEIPEEQQQPRPRKSATVSTAKSSASLLIKEGAPIVIAARNSKPSANVEAPTAVPVQPKKTPLIISSRVAEEKKLEATKRKLHEQYQQAEDAKRRRTIQVMEPQRPPPVMTGQRQRIAHPGVRAPGLASCTAERVLNKSLSRRMKV
jgi:hypothetical protein